MVYARGQYYVCDTEADIKDLPTNRRPGTIAKVLDPSATYALNSSGEWIQQSSGSTSGGSGGSTQDIHVSNIDLDDEDNLIVTFNTGKAPISVNLGSINDPEIQDIYEQLNNLQVTEIDSDYLKGLFNKN